MDINFEYIKTEKAVIVVKDDGGSLPKGHHAAVVVSKDVKGKDVEWFEDAYGKLLLVKIFLQNGSIEYL